MQGVKAINRENADFRTRLRSVRESLGLSQADAAVRVGATTTQWGNWERHNVTAEPNIAMLSAIAGAYDVSLHWLLTGAGPRSAAAVEASTGGAAAPSDIERLVRALSSDELRQLAERRAKMEQAILEGPLADVVRDLRDIVKQGQAPLDRVRDMLLRAIEEASKEPEDPLESGRVVRVVEPPRQRDGHVEQVHREYEIREPDKGDRASRRAKEG